MHPFVLTYIATMNSLFVMAIVPMTLASMDLLGNGQRLIAMSVFGSPTPHDEPPSQTR